MNNMNPELRIKLAGEYVLGTLRGGARRRFAQHLQTDPALQNDVADWQTRLMPFVEGIQPVKPSSRVWRKIQRGLDFQAATLFGLRFWRTIGMFSSGIAAILILYLATNQHTTSNRDAIAIAVISDSHATPGWLIQNMGTQLKIKAIKPTLIAKNQSLELWVLPENGTHPIPLGLLPTSGKSLLSLSRAQQQLLAQNRHLAISLEPLGGSPTGLPTGPVLYQATMVI